MTTDSTANPSLAEDTGAALTSDANTGITASPSENAETQAPAETGDNTASSPDALVDDRASLLEVVRSVVQAAPKNPPGEGQAAAPDLNSPTTDKTTDTQAAAETLEADPTEAELVGLKPRTKQRIDKLLEQRNAARTETETLKPHAARWQQMESYLSKHELAAEDVNLLLGVGAALRRGDFKAFRDGVMPYIELANEHLGITLPADLQIKVESGELAAEAAKELSMTRLAHARLQGQVQATTQATQAAQVAEEQNRSATAMHSAVSSWEQSVMSRDPDYAKKAPTVLRISQALIAERGRPKTEAEAVKFASDAYDEVNRTFAALKPAPVPVRPSPSGVRAASGARPEPTTMREAIMMGLERGRA